MGKEKVLTKRELVVEVAAKLGLTQNEVSEILQQTLDTITGTLVEGHRLEIRNFGVFEIKERDARVGRNPRTGQEVPIPQKRVASFRPGKALKEWVQAGADNKPHHLFKSDHPDMGMTSTPSSPSSDGIPTQGIAANSPAASAGRSMTES